MSFPSPTRSGHQYRRPGRSGRSGRSGVATVEVAICLPVLITLTLATMDLCSLFFLRETVTLAAYEGARQGISLGSTNASAATRVNEFLDGRGVVHSGDVTTVSGGGFDNAQTLENVTVTVTVPCAGNLLGPAGLYGNWTVSSSVTMRKEYKNRN